MDQNTVFTYACLWATTISMTTTKYTSNTGDFNCHGDVAVLCTVHCPMEHLPGFNRRRWTSHCRSGRHGRRFWLKTQNTNKRLFLAS